MANEVVAPNANVIETSKAAVTNVTQNVTDAFVATWNQIVEFAPRFLGALVVFIVGYIVAKMVARLVTTLCDRLGLEKAAERGGLTKSMSQVGINRNVSSIVGTFTFWLLLCVFLMAGFNILSLTPLTKAMESVVSFIPNLFVATVVVVVGLMLASFLRGVIATSADRVGLTYAEQLASGCYYVLAAFVMIAAAQQLKWEFALLNNLILITFSGLAIGFALALGLGGRDVMAGILSGYYLRQRLHAGDHVTIGNLEGTVREVGPTATIIETDEDGLVNRRTIPNAKMLNEAVR